MTTRTEMTGQVVVDEMRGRIGFPAQDYWISLGLIQTQRDLIAWIFQLSLKSWMTTELLEQFIREISILRGWTDYKAGVRHEI